MARPFPLLSRLLHWTMALLILAMLFIGVAMVSSLSDYHRLVAIHRPLGILLLVLVAVRLINRLLSPPPPLPAAMPAVLRLAAAGLALAALCPDVRVPLVGWAMLSAGGLSDPARGRVHLPPILPHDRALYAVLRPAHTVLAFLLFATFLAHLGAALTHALVFKDGVFRSMVK